MFIINCLTFSQLTNLKLSLINNVRSHINRKFDQKTSLLSSFGSSGSLSGGISFGSKSSFGDSSSVSPSKSSDDSSDLTLDDFGSDLEPGVSISDGSD